jgi:hypothetical protein
MRRNKGRGRAKRRRALSLHCLATRCSPSSERVRHCTATGVRPRAGEGQGCDSIQITIFNGCFVTPTSFVPVGVGPRRRDCAKACMQADGGHASPAHRLAGARRPDLLQCFPAPARHRPCRPSTINCLFFPLLLCFNLGSLVGVH